MSSGDGDIKTELSSKRDRVAIEKDLREVDATVSELESQADIFMAGYQNEFDRFGNLSVRLGNMVLNNQTSELSELGESLDGREKEFYNGAVPLLSQAASLRSRQVLLQEEHLPYIVEDLIQTVNTLSSQIDYVSLLKYHEKQNNIGLESTSDVLVNSLLQTEYVRKCQATIMDGPENISYDAGKHMLDSLSGYEAEWIQKGFLRRGSEKKVGAEVIPVSIDHDIRMAVLDKFKRASLELEEFKHLSYIYKPTLIFKGVFDNYMEEIIRSIDLEDGADEYFTSAGIDIRTNGMDPAYLQGVDEFLSDRIASYKSQGFLSGGAPDTKTEAASVRPEDIAIIGFEAISEEDILMDQKQFRAAVLNPLPRGFLKGVRSITLKARPDDIDQIDPTVETIGSCIPEFDDKRSFKSTVVEIYLPNTADPKLSTGKLAANKQELITTGWHEVAHNAHANLTFDEMNGWEEVMNSDPTTITWYVKHTTKNTEEDPTRRKREDFSESFARYMDDPALLQALSPKRYEYMTDLFLSRTPEDQLPDVIAKTLIKVLISKASWKANGYDDDFLKAVYLPR